MTSISFQISAVQTSFYFLFMSTRSQWAMSQKQKALVAAKSQLGVTGKRDQGMNQVLERKQNETQNNLGSSGKEAALLKSPFWKALAGLSGLQPEPRIWNLFHKHLQSDCNDSQSTLPRSFPCLPLAPLCI